MFKTLTITGIIFAISLAFSSSNEVAYKVLESATPGILGAILGGLTAGVSVIFSVLITAAAQVGSADKFQKFIPFLSKLKQDMLILVACLVVSLLLPYLRVTGVPLLLYPEHNLVPDRDTFYTAVQLTAIIFSVAIIVEVINVMFALVSHMPKLLIFSDKTDKTDKSSET
ncbi:hypothetical protein ACVEU1_001714 [Vibrio parahaemolyticus]|nr:hypothetical protein [Vibrio parahaemolyticus]